jgi:hypothetical protein
MPTPAADVRTVKRAAPSAAGVLLADATPNDLEYLKSHGVTACLTDMLGSMLENRPADPIVFISEYLDHASVGDINPMRRCYRYVRLSNPASPAFMDNLAAGYAAVDLHLGLTGSRLADLVRMLCSELPFEAVSSVLQLVNTTGTAADDRVSFADFVAVVSFALAYNDLAGKGRRVFKACVADTTDGMSTRAFLAIIRQVQAIMEPHTGGKSIAEQMSIAEQAVTEQAADVRAGREVGDVSFDEFLAVLLRNVALGQAP